MQTIRRLYFYLITLISVEVIIWGVISLARTLFSPSPHLGSSILIASGLSLLLVGVPIFILHWLLAQREAHKDIEERNTRIRALFLYSVRFASLIPALQNALAIVNRLFLSLAGLSTTRAFVGGEQTILDNLVAIAVNLVAWFYFDRVLRSDWHEIPAPIHLPPIRRLQRYLWVIYGLVLTITGVYQSIFFVLNYLGDYNLLSRYQVVSGLAFLLVGAPVWVFYWRLIQGALAENHERFSTLRVIFLYIASLAGLFTMLGAAGPFITNILETLMGITQTLRSFILENAGAVAIGIPMGIVWAYHSNILKKNIADQPDPLHQAGLKRLYAYIISFIGCVVVFFSIWSLLDMLAAGIADRVLTWGIIRAQLAGTIAALFIGLPMWLLTWRPMQANAALTTEVGDHARRSIVRKIYLYLALFLTVVGSMGAAGYSLYLIFMRLFGSSTTSFTLDLLRSLFTLLLTLVWLVYHLLTLRQDGRLAHHSLGKLHSLYPVAVLYDKQSAYTGEIVEALTRRAPQMPVKVINIDEGLASEELKEMKAVILDTSLAVSPPDPLREWLLVFEGRRICIPGPVENWHWVDSAPRSPKDLARLAADAASSLAEGQLAAKSSSVNAWAIVGYVAVGLIGFLTIFSIIMSLIEG